MIKTKTVAYLRVSTDSQADKGFSLQAQEEKVKQYAALYDLELIDIVIDAGASAKSIDRPGLQRALGMLKAGEATALLVVKLDRLTRKVADLGRLIEDYFSGEKLALLSVSEQIDTRSASGRLILNILASVSQWEREAIGERTRETLQSKKARGEVTGRIPYGYTAVINDKGVKMLEPMIAELAVIKIARELRKAGLSLKKIAIELDKRGIQSRNGKVFVAMQVSRMMEAAWSRQHWI